MAEASIRINLDPESLQRLEKEAEDWVSLANQGLITDGEMERMVAEITGDLKLQVGERSTTLREWSGDADEDWTEEPDHD